MDKSKPLSTARDVMQTALVSLSPDMEILQAVRILLGKAISGAPVVDDQNRLLGVLTERDCVRVLSAAAYHRRPEGTVEEHMSKDVSTTGAEDDPFHLTYLFQDKVRRVFVVDDDRKVVGIIAPHDLLKGLDRFCGLRESAPHKTTYDLIEENRK